MKLRSATDILLPKSFEIIWRRGEGYADQGQVTLAKSDDVEARAFVRGGEEYAVSLEFSGGGIKKKCTCPYAGNGSLRGPVCKHMVAVAILWDKKRQLNVPTDEEIEENTIAEPAVTKQDAEEAHSDPLHADLEVVRLAASELSRSAKPHSRLPLMPKMIWETSRPVTQSEVKKALQTISRWVRRSDYDNYYCAGEMVAAFCEVLRRVLRRALATSPLVLAAILLDAQKFHYKLVQELIDDSDGLHVFSEEHLDELRDVIKSLKPKPQDKQSIDEKLWNYDVHRDDY
jgi:hypothetical protein